jgi:acyl carrier protein
MGVSIEKITATTSLGDLAADELDYVELIMELEECFSITIPDDAAERLAGNRDWRQGMKSVTIQKLSTLVDDRSKSKPN